MRMIFRSLWIIILLVFISVLLSGPAFGASQGEESTVSFPRPLDSYEDAGARSIMAILTQRIKEEPFNLVATLIFLCAIVHTFLTSKFLSIAHKWQHEFEVKKEKGLARKHDVHHGAELFDFLGEVEAVFGIWAIALAVAIAIFYDWTTVVHYIGYKVNFSEAVFVVVIMTLASTRPILKLAESVILKTARLIGGSLTAFWLVILVIGPLLGSLVTEPAAMTISALLLSRQFYDLNPSTKFKYATIGLLLVNVSVGGTLTHFAAPPVLMVSGPWQWGLLHMLTHFGWKAVIGILISSGIYYLMFKNELADLQKEYAVRQLKDEIQQKYISRDAIEAETEKHAALLKQESDFTATCEYETKNLFSDIKERLETQFLDNIVKKGVDPDLVREAFDARFEEIRLARMRERMPGLLPKAQQPRFLDPAWDQRDDPVPAWIMLVHAIFMVWTIVNVHHPQLIIFGLLFFLGFAQVTAPFQNRINLKSPMLVGFFLAGLVVHGGLQGWWIAPVLGSLSEIPLMLGATILTAFNDNAAITYLATLVPGFTDSLKYAVVAGAVTGGGLTVIANAPNPAGLSILKVHFENGVSPMGLLKASLLPTIVVGSCFLLLR